MFQFKNNYEFLFPREKFPMIFLHTSVCLHYVNSMGPIILRVQCPFRIRDSITCCKICGQFICSQRGRVCPRPLHKREDCIQILRSHVCMLLINVLSVVHYCTERQPVESSQSVCSLAADLAVWQFPAAPTASFCNMQFSTNTKRILFDVMAKAVAILPVNQ